MTDDAESERVIELVIQNVQTGFEISQVIRHLIKQSDPNILKRAQDEFNAARDRDAGLILYEKRERILLGTAWTFQNGESQTFELGTNLIARTGLGTFDMSTSIRLCHLRAFESEWPRAYCAVSNTNQHLHSIARKLQKFEAFTVTTEKNEFVRAKQEINPHFSLANHTVFGFSEYSYKVAASYLSEVLSKPIGKRTYLMPNRPNVTVAFDIPLLFEPPFEVLRSIVNGASIELPVHRKHIEATTRLI